MSNEPTLRTYSGLFLVTLATLMLQILLTRIFSVTLWYHFAFMAVSIAMFGITVGAVYVYIRAGRFREELVRRQMARAALGFAVSIVICFAAQIYLPYVTGTGSISPDAGGGDFLGTVLYLGSTYMVAAIPFVFSGVVVCLALTRFPGRVNRLYAVDLAGAALGCVLLVIVLRWTDGPAAVLITAAVASVGALSFARDTDDSILRNMAGAAALLLTGVAVLVAWSAAEGRPVVRMHWVKGYPAIATLYEHWNSFAYFLVSGDPDKLDTPFGWGFAERAKGHGVRQLTVGIDAGAGTIMTGFDGDFSRLLHLEYDVTNVAHHLLDDARVLIVGTGGGRDVLSALYFEQREILGVEINGDLIAAVNERFGEFTGHLDRYPNVQFVNDEARSFIVRQRDPFDLIQVSMIDTWAATAAGAFVLTENGLYTIEAWEMLLDRLQPHGLLSFSRWYVPAQPAESHRLTALAVEALRRRGVVNPRRHLINITNLSPSSTRRSGICTLLVSPTPLSADVLERLDRVVESMGFQILVGPEVGSDTELERIVEADDLAALAAEFPLDISPPTDDRPFFFNMLPLRKVFSSGGAETLVNDANINAVRVLGALVVTVLTMTAFFVLGPLAVTAQRPIRASWIWLGFFAAIGLGFMLIEISQIQRLIVFLGHPVYGLTVLLFALLLSSGVGSMFTPAVADAPAARRAAWRLTALLILLVVFGVLTPALTSGLRGASTPLRIAVAAGAMMPLGLFMGTAFPLGMAAASLRFEHMTPWFWGTNGATSICASVLAVAIALTGGISMAYWSGAVCYGIAAVLFGLAVRPGS